MLVIVGIWVAIILVGVNLGMSLCFVPVPGGKGDWVVVGLITPAMMLCAVLLSLSLWSVL